MVYRIKVSRSPVCMADDFSTAGDREKEFVYDPGDRLSTLLQDIGKFIPDMRDVVWSIRCGKQIIGYLYSAGENPYQPERIMEDVPVSELPAKEVSCKYYCTDAYEIRAFEKEKGISLPDRPYLKRVMAYEAQRSRAVGEDLFFSGI